MPGQVFLHSSKVDLCSMPSDSAPSAVQDLRAARCLARTLHPNWENMPCSTTISAIFVLAAHRCIDMLIILLGHGHSGLKSYRYVFINDAAQGDVDIGAGYHMVQTFRLSPCI